jgi:hypothetical protein
MTERLTRVYTLLAAALVFVVAWAAVAAHPWNLPRRDPRLAALALRERMLRADARLVARIVASARQTASTQARGRHPTRQSGTGAVAAAAPRVRIVTLPPLTITRTS